MAKIIKQASEVTKLQMSQKSIIEFEVGDVCVLKSGGPLMTVEKVSHDDRKVYCCWMNEVATVQGRFFEFDTLRKQKNK